MRSKRLGKWQKEIKKVLDEYFKENLAGFLKTLDINLIGYERIHDYTFIRLLGKNYEQHPQYDNLEHSWTRLFCEEDSENRKIIERLGYTFKEVTLPINSKEEKYRVIYPIKEKEKVEKALNILSLKRNLPDKYCIRKFIKRNLTKLRKFISKRNPKYFLENLKKIKQALKELHRNNAHIGAVIYNFERNLSKENFEKVLIKILRGLFNKDILSTDYSELSITWIECVKVSYKMLEAIDIDGNYPLEKIVGDSIKDIKKLKSWKKIRNSLENMAIILDEILKDKEGLQEKILQKHIKDFESLIMRCAKDSDRESFRIFITGHRFMGTLIGRKIMREIVKNRHKYKLIRYLEKKFGVDFAETLEKEYLKDDSESSKKV